MTSKLTGDKGKYCLQCGVSKQNHAIQFADHEFVLDHAAELIEGDKANQQTGESERAEFEKWARNSGFTELNFSPAMVRGKDSGSYSYGSTQLAWEAWQARAELREVRQHPEPAKEKP